jgi:hypothetical protein
MFDQEAVRIAANCRHYAMCKIDYLGTGICPAIETNPPYVTYYPEGRMVLYKALAEGAVPVTDVLVDSIETCSLCGACDKQCYFVTELRPIKVMRALWSFRDAHRRQGKPILTTPPDEFLGRLQDVVGKRYASNDPAHLVCYSSDPSPMARPQAARYVALPGTAGEVSELVRACRAAGVPYQVRGNGSSTMGFALSSGLIIDMNRMRRIVIDTDRHTAEVEAGVTSFELQREAARHGLRANVAEPAATACGNLMCSGIFSLWSASYGTCAANAVNAELVGPDGTIFDLNRKSAPNLFGFEKTDVPLPGIVTRSWIKLYPVTADEAGLLIPFADFHWALDLAQDLNRRRIGLAVGVVGAEYAAAFIAPTLASGHRLKNLFTRVLGIEGFILVAGDRFDLEAARTLAEGRVIDADLFRRLWLGLPSLVDDRLVGALEGYQGDRPAYEFLTQPEFRPIVESALQSSPEALASLVDPELREFFAGVYRKPEMTDLVWLNMFRVLSTRMGREKHFVACIVYLPLDKKDLILSVRDRVRDAADRHGIANHYGFVVPVDFGKRALLEYDYYLDQTDPDEVKRAREAAMEAGAVIMDVTAKVPGVVWIRFFVNQGLSRTENAFYL